MLSYDCELFPLPGIPGAAAGAAAPAVAPALTPAGTAVAVVPAGSESAASDAPAVIVAPLRLDRAGELASALDAGGIRAAAVLPLWDDGAGTIVAAREGVA